MRNAVFTILALMVLWPAVAADDIRFRMSPNPAATYVRIDPDFYAGEVRVEFFTVIGNRVLDQKFYPQFEGQSIEVSLSGMAEGIYLVRVTAGSQSAVKRLRVEHH